MIYKCIPLVLGNLLLHLLAFWGITSFYTHRWGSILATGNRKTRTRVRLKNMYNCYYYYYILLILLLLYILVIVNILAKNPNRIWFTLSSSICSQEPREYRVSVNNIDTCQLWLSVRSRMQKRVDRTSSSSVIHWDAEWGWLTSCYTDAYHVCPLIAFFNSMEYWQLCNNLGQINNSIK